MKNPQRPLSTLILAAALAALSHPAGAQETSQPPPQGTQASTLASSPAPAPGRGQAIVASGVLSRDRDCQLLRTPSGQVYVLIGRLSQATAGAHIRVAGRRGGRSACRQGPPIRVDSVRPDELVPAPRQPGEPLPPTGDMVSHRIHQMDDAARPGGAKRLQATGTLTEGVECPALRTADGTIYTLAGDLKGWKTGDRVTVTGTRAQVSTCQQGTTIEVEDIRPPR